MTINNKQPNKLSDKEIDEIMAEKIRTPKGFVWAYIIGSAIIVIIVILVVAI